jgi:CubicO group peptidase (beta-lactamase class C family)
MVLALPLLPTFVATCTLFGRVTADPVDKYLRSQMSLNHIPGLAVAVVRDGRLVKLTSFGAADLEWGNKVTPDTRFQLASSTKPLTGTALMRLVQAGKIGLDDPISKYLPNAPEAWRKITIRHLATHSSGIPEGPAPSYQSVDAVVDAVAKLPLEHVPGADSGYGSADFVVLSAILQKVTGLPFDRFLSQTLLAPLKMSETGFNGMSEMGPIRSSEVVPNQAGIYLWNGERQQVRSFLFSAPAYSAGGIYSSVRDLARFAAALDRGALLKPEVLSTMWTPHRLNDGKQTTWGIGWVVRSYEGRRTVGHSGGPALSDFLRFPDDRLTVIVLQNQQKMYPYLARGVADFYLSQRSGLAVQPVPDSKLEVTNRLTKMLNSFSAGEFDSAAFSPDQKDLMEDVRNLLVPFCVSLGAPTSITLIGEAPDGKVLERTYAAFYGKKRVEWIFDLDANGKIVGIDPQTP